MKQFPKWIFLFSILLMIFVCLPVLVHAQIEPGCDVLDPGCPIDGGLSALLAIGVGYGIKKIRKAQVKGEGKIAEN